MILLVIFGALILFMLPLWLLTAAMVFGTLKIFDHFGID